MPRWFSVEWHRSLFSIAQVRDTTTPRISEPAPPHGCGREVRLSATGRHVPFADRLSSFGTRATILTPVHGREKTLRNVGIPRAFFVAGAGFEPRVLNRIYLYMPPVGDQGLACHAATTGSAATDSRLRPSGCESRYRYSHEPADSACPQHGATRHWDSNSGFPQIRSCGLTESLNPEDQRGEQHRVANEVLHGPSQVVQRVAVRIRLYT
jgi:hypothetical protein